MSKLDLAVCDLVIKNRTASIDTVCPHCKADLMGEGTLRHVEYAPQARRVDVVLGPKQNTDGRSVIKWGTHLGEPFEGGQLPHAWECAECGHTLLEGKEKVERD